MVSKPLNVRAVYVLYTNYKGETAWRTIKPLRTYEGKSKWHPEKQWLMDVWDYEKEAERTFAIKDISEWELLN